MMKLLIPLSMALLLSKCSFLPVDAEMQRQVEDLAGQIPIHQSFREVGKRSLAANANVILISKSFRSDAEYETVKDYYKEVMSQPGWRLVEEKPIRNWGVDYGGRSLTFIKGQYLFSIQYAGKGDPELTWDYSLSYEWDSPEFRTRVKNLPLN